MVNCEVSVQCVLSVCMCCYTSSDLYFSFIFHAKINPKTLKLPKGTIKSSGGSAETSELENCSLDVKHRWNLFYLLEQWMSLCNVQLIDRSAVESRKHVTQWAWISTQLFDNPPSYITVWFIKFVQSWKGVIIRCDIWHYASYGRNMDPREHMLFLFTCMKRHKLLNEHVDMLILWNKTCCFVPLLFVFFTISWC